MKRKKRLIAGLLFALSAITGTASAEQPAAEEYRKIFQSGTFYVEYKDKYTTRILAAENGQRMERTSYNTPGWVSFMNPLGAIFGGGEPKHPEVMYKDGNYYQFTENDKSYILPEEHMDDENLDPRQGWSTVRQKLALPMELAIFFWEDPYRGEIRAIAAPAFLETTKKILDNKEYICDRYASSIRRADGQEEAQIVYDALYDNQGHLLEIRSAVLSQGTEYPSNAVKAIKILAKAPDNAFSISKKTKVYEAGRGDMNDLLGQPAQIGQMEGLK